MARATDARHRHTGSRDYNEQSRYAKTIRKDNATWGEVPADSNQLAHRDNNMTCVRVIHRG